MTHQCTAFVNVKSTNDANNALSLMTQCVEAVRVWMTQSLLKLNEDKTDFLSSPLPISTNLSVTHH